MIPPHMKTILSVTIATITALMAVAPIQARQLITDDKAGVVLGEVKCGKRDPAVAVRYLNTVGFPVSKMNNPTKEMAQGYRRATYWC